MPHLNITKILYTVTLMISIALTVNGQINFEQSISINDDGSDPHGDAILDLKSTSQGLLIPRMTSAQRTAITGTEGLMVYDTETNNFWFHDGSNWASIGSASTDSVIIQSAIKLKPNDSNSSGLLQLNDSDGNPGVNIYGHNPGQGAGYVEFFNSDGVQTGFINGDDPNNGMRMILKDSLGNNRLQFNTNHQATGDARVVTDEIEIRGGSDLAELFDINESTLDIESGMIVSLDPTQPGKLKISDQAYDKKVVGVVSGANGIKPGILMGQDETIATGEDLVTLSGRTFIKANLNGGKIQVGDFITTSDVPGEAMKAKRKKKARGSIIGKAMTTLDKESGYVLVLVTLQ